MSRISFAVYDEAGEPLVGAAPSLVQYRDVFTYPVVPPPVVELGGGLYAFRPRQAEVLNGGTYLIATGGSPRYLAGGIGPMVGFALYNVSGEPDPSASLSFEKYVDAATGDAVSQPILWNIGGGLYGFISLTSGIDIAWQVVAPDASPQRLAGTVDASVVAPGGPGERPVVKWLSPTPGTEISSATVLTVEVTDPEGHLDEVLLMCAFPGLYEVVHDGQDFAPGYMDTPNARVQIPNGWRFTLLRKGGWFMPPTLKVQAYDAVNRGA